jgi:hypothetical protein
MCANAAKILTYLGDPNLSAVEIKTHILPMNDAQWAGVGTLGSEEEGYCSPTFQGDTGCLVRNGTFSYKLD